MILHQVSRFLVNTLMLRKLRGPFLADGGHCWAAELPRLAHLADDPTDPRRSTLALYEDGVPLHPAHSRRPAIRRYGRGQYVHWQEGVFFAASDNSDPNTNGRTYTWSASPWLFRRRVARWGEEGGLPVNHRRRDASPEQIRADVDYTLRVGSGYLATIRRESSDLRGKTVLEVGPGIHDGCALLLAAFGARPMVLDRFLAPWDPAYHPAFYSLLREDLTERFPDADVRPISALLDAGDYVDDVITRHEAALEENPVAADSVDVVISNAVVEHLYDLSDACAALYRMTRPGGVGLHQVDFRDHRDFTRPLEYLLLGDEAFHDLFERCHGQIGNRHRPDDTAAAFRAAGFEVESFEPNAFADADYLRKFVPRLREAKGSRYGDRRAEDLRVVSGFFRVRKPHRGLGA
jgi:SAM-dependent methyltransferase